MFVCLFSLKEKLSHRNRYQLHINCAFKGTLPILTERRNSRICVLKEHWKTTSIQASLNVAFFFEFSAIATQRLEKQTGKQKKNEAHEDSRYDPLYYVLSIKAT